MSGIRFLQRLDRGIRHTDAGAYDEREIVASVHEHMINMLNTRQGSVPAQPHYGLPDFNDIAKRFPDSIQELKREILRCIHKYEPRLGNVEIHYVADGQHPLDMSYEIKADILVGSQKSKIMFETTMHASGHVDVRGW